jgi:hypothetical protein
MTSMARSALVSAVRPGIRFRELFRQVDIDPQGAPDATKKAHGGPVESKPQVRCAPF